ncbi:sensor histidine kinase [Phycicoccus sonneratiae]|uniref:histidine kinase n=1 Tax=Phycicoccus sonneratiae TaxID=2807628 RepID=A0ABS2CS27_9MICO|nr:HAMP domain-containing sensor histidine kinase [Phycicoccus sonneraticus]MBM6402283.1 HAMP domain-containing histidine kinase [Phycicoccus sonneraticus]
MSGTDRGTPQHRVLRSLRRRLLATVVVVVTLGVGSACVVLVARDVQLSRERADSDLLAVASRAAALVYLDDDGAPRTDAVADDDVTAGGARVLVVSDLPGSAASPVLLDSRPGAGDTGALAPLLAGARADAAEEGSLADVRLPGGTRRAAAMPWFSGDAVAGVAVAVEGNPRRLASPLLVPILAAGAGLVALFTALGWVLTARSLRPAVQAAADREQFLATAAHELKAPLAHVRAAAEALGRGQPPGSPAWSASRAVLRDADGASSVVGNLLLAARIDNADVPTTRSPVRLDRIASDLELRHPGVVAVVDEAVVVDGDEALLRHALGNLVENALLHGAADADVRIELRRTGTRAVVRVVDRGPGLPGDVDVRRPYAGTGTGTGLGLSLVEWVAARHGGRLDLAPGDDGTGTVATLDLPLGSGPAA